MKKTKRLVTTLLAGVVVSSMTGCGSQAAPAVPSVPMPTDPGCSDWEWEADDGVWECDDERSPHYGGFFYAGIYYASKSKLRSSPAYNKYYSGYKNSIGTGKTGNTGGTGQSDKSGGFGSGSKGGSGG